MFKAKDVTGLSQATDSVYEIINKKEFLGQRASFLFTAQEFLHFPPAKLYCFLRLLNSFASLCMPKTTKCLCSWMTREVLSYKLCNLPGTRKNWYADVFAYSGISYWMFLTCKLQLSKRCVFLLWFIVTLLLSVCTHEQSRSGFSKKSGKALFAFTQCLSEIIMSKFVDLKQKYLFLQ